MSPISNASRLAEFGSGIGTAGAVIQVDNVNERVGIGTTNTQAMLQVGTAISMFGSTGIVSATEYRGDGSNLSGLATTETVRTDTLTVAGVSTFTGALNATSVVSSGAVSGTTGTFSGAVNVDATTDSTSSTTGSLIISGGVGIAKSLFVGNNVTIGGTLTYEVVTIID